MWTSRGKHAIARQQQRLIFQRAFGKLARFAYDKKNPDLKVAFLGLGLMGKGMYQRLANQLKGSLSVYDVNPKLVEEATEFGCIPMRTVKDVGHSSPDIIFTSLPTTGHGIQVAHQLLKSNDLKKGAVWVDFTSGRPKEAREIHSLMKEAGVTYLDAGVAGGPRGAANGTLSMMIGGNEEVLDQVRPILKIMSTPGKVVWLGPCGAGHAVKSVNNALLASNILSVGEALALLAKHDIPMESALAAINASSGRSLVSAERFPAHVLSRKFDFGFKLALMEKDTDIAVELLNEASMSAPSLRWANTAYKIARGKLGPDEEHMKVVHMAEDEAKTEIKATPGSTQTCDPIVNPIRCFNFSAGPACVPTDVMKKIQKNFVSWEDTGMGFIEMSHRDAGGPVQKAIVNGANLIRKLMNVPENYHILFFHGGAHGQFAGMPLNLAHENKKVDILDMGFWTKRAQVEAEKMCDVNIPYKCTSVMGPPSEWNYRKDAAYIHMCMNETISGLEVLEDFDMPADAPPIVVDATSTFLSRQMDISKYGVVYASAGKNLGPAGVTVVIIRDDLAKRTQNPMTPGILSISEHVNSKPIHSLYNTPPVFQIYAAYETLKWIEGKGGVAAMEEQAIRRSTRMYDIMDESEGFYTNSIDKKFRSRMNICFTIQGGDTKEAHALEAKFVTEAEDAGLFQLFRHPSSGGLRITSYNGLEEEAIDAVCGYLVDFHQKNKFN